MLVGLKNITNSLLHISLVSIHIAFHLNRFSIDATIPNAGLLPLPRHGLAHALAHALAHTRVLIHQL